MKTTLGLAGALLTSLLPFAAAKVDNIPSIGLGTWLSERKKVTATC